MSVGMRFPHFVQEKPLLVSVIYDPHLSQNFMNDEPAVLEDFSFGFDILVGFE